MPVRPAALVAACSAMVVLSAAVPTQGVAQVVADGAGNRAVRLAAVAYVVPVPGEVVRGFDGPARFGPGHRGLDLYAPAGTPVRASAAGRVTFAGTVAGVGWVTIRHADGVRTSYGHLGLILVQAGEDVTDGRVVALAAGDRVRGRPHVHFGARDDHGYLDPNRLLRPAAVRVRIDQPGRGRVVAAR